MRTIGSIERFLVVGIVLVIGAILMVAIKGAGDFEQRQEALAGADGKSGDGKLVAAKGKEAKGDPKKADPKKDAANQKRPNPAPESPVGPHIRNVTPIVPRDDPQAALVGGPAGGDAPVPGGATGDARGEGDAGEAENGRRTAPPENATGNPLIDNLLDLHRKEALLAGDVRRDDETAAPPVVIDDEPGVGAKESGSAAPGTKPDAPVVEAAPREYVYEVQSGDSLERIARSVYGDGAEWKAILAANPTLADKNTIRVGMKLKLPKVPTQGLDLVQAVDGSGAAKGAAAAKVAKSEPAPLVSPATVGGGFKRVTSSSEHAVAKGDTLMSIALANYGTKAAWKLVFEANADRISDKDRLRVGTVLRLPPN